MNYRTRVITDLGAIDAMQWDALVAQSGLNGHTRLGRPMPDPFLRHAFLHALHDTGCAQAATGWSPEYLTLWKDDILVAAAPLYRKTHSYGEYVFDWAWADAYQRSGLPYYPKLLCAVPFTPVTGSRLLSADDATRAALSKALLEHARSSGLSSLHVLFPTEDEARLLESHGMRLRDGVQFHWSNPGYDDFGQFLASLERKKRKNILAERRKVAEAGVVLRRVPGTAATQEDWLFFVHCYRNTYRAHYSTPYLNAEFFLRIGATMPENLLLVLAERGNQPIATALVVHTTTTVYGRYWGETVHVPCLHFEAAYYQPIEYCIENGISLFEGGAQGEHKMARGFLPVRTHSAHWLAHPAFAEAVGHYLQRESTGISHYLDELNEHNPFRTAAKQ